MSVAPVIVPPIVAPISRPRWRADRARAWGWGVALTVLATLLRLAWVLAVPTVPVGDFAMYRESANYLSEFGALDHGFIYMPGFVVLLSLVKDLGGDLLAQKMIGVALGGLGAAGIFATTLHLFDRAGGPDTRRGCLTAIVATTLYALWPAGIAMSSVVGTDVPAAALIVLAVASLVALAGAHPWRAAIAFGLVMGLAALVRAVALPLAALSLVYWLALRVRPWLALRLTALSVATTLLVLSPWAVRNLRHEGQLFFTDCHGGITALIGTNPNSEGTYSRALNQLFHDVTGHSVLDEPHRVVDGQAYRLAKDWARFEPAYALGLAARRAERLFDAERYLLYWPIFRPGVLVAPHDGFFVRHRAGIAAAADLFGLGMLALFLVGLALAVAERRALALTLLPLQLGLAATYIIFFAEPRYRIPIEMMAFPVVAFAGVGFARAARSARGGKESHRARRTLALALPLAAVLLAAALVGVPRIFAAGADLRARHRWAVTPWRVDDHIRLARWRRADADLARGAQGGERDGSVLLGAPDGARISVHPTGITAVEVWLDGGDLPAGAYRLETHLKADLTAAGAPGLQLRIAAPSPDPGLVFSAPAGQLSETIVAGGVQHQGGPLRLDVTVTVTAPTTAGGADLWLTGTTLVRQEPGGRPIR